MVSLHAVTQKSLASMCEYKHIHMHAFIAYYVLTNNYVLTNKYIVWLNLHKYKHIHAGTVPIFTTIYAY